MFHLRRMIWLTLGGSSGSWVQRSARSQHVWCLTQSDVNLSSKLPVCLSPLEALSGQ